MAANAKNGRIKYEGGQSTVGYTAMTDSGDQTIFTVSGAPLYSGRSGFEPTARPDGIVSVTGGGFPLTVHATNDTVTIAGGTCYFAGVLVTWADTTKTITRGGIGTEWMKNSVIVNSSGVVSVIQPDGHASAFSLVRGAAGGPPTLTVGSVELGQIHTDSDTAAAITATEIKQNPSADQAEWSSQTVWSINNIGIGQKSSFTGANSAEKNAHVTFSDALAITHGAAVDGAATTARAIYLTYSVPSMSNAAYAKDWKGALNAVSLTSEQFFDATRGSTSTALNAGSFIFSPAGNPVTDPLLKLSGELLTFQCYPDKNQLPYDIMQGYFSHDTTYVAEGVYSSAITVTPEVESAGFSGT